jgi:hypothetical protein
MVPFSFMTRRRLARARRELIASSPELQERDLIKMTSLASAIAETLRQRHVPTRTATFAAQAAMAVFTIAYGDWVDDSTADFCTLMQRSLADLRQAAGCTRGYPDPIRCQLQPPMKPGDPHNPGPIRATASHDRCS